MIAFLFIISMLLYSPLLIYSALNYAIMFASISLFFIYLSFKDVISTAPLKYFSILLSVFIINFIFGHERNIPWFFNHIGYCLFAYIVSHLYLCISNLKLQKFLSTISKFNDLLCVLIACYIVILVFFVAGFSTVIKTLDWNGLLYMGTERFGMPKAQLTTLVAYCTIWLALARSKKNLLLFALLVLPVYLSGRSSIIAVVVTLLYLWRGKLPRHAAFKIFIVFILLAMAILVLSAIPSDFLKYDRAANFMVSVDLANAHIFGHGNGTYHFYVERNQSLLDDKYSYLFSKWQVEVFKGPESMFNHILGSFGYILASVFFTLQGWTLYWSHKLYLEAHVGERFFFLFWFSLAVSGIGQTQIMGGFPYFAVWALVVGAIFRIRHKKTRNVKISGHERAHLVVSN